MNIAITFRQLEPSDAVKRYAHEKIAKLQKFLRQPMQANVTLHMEKIEHVVEVRISSGSEHFNGTERSGDMYASIDVVVDKLERQIRSGKVVQKKKGGVSAGQFAADGAPALASDFESETDSKE